MQGSVHASLKVSKCSTAGCGACRECCASATAQQAAKVRSGSLLLGGAGQAAGGGGAGSGSMGEQGEWRAHAGRRLRAGHAPSRPSVPASRPTHQTLAVGLEAHTTLLGAGRASAALAAGASTRVTAARPASRAAAAFLGACAASQMGHRGSPSVNMLPEGAGRPRTGRTAPRVARDGWEVAWFRQTPAAPCCPAIGPLAAHLGAGGSRLAAHGHRGPAGDRGRSLHALDSHSLHGCGMA